MSRKEYDFDKARGESKAHKELLLIEIVILLLLVLWALSRALS